MKAVVITTPGGPEVLELQEVEDPAIADDEVLIKVVTTAINRADTIQRVGGHPPPKGANPYLGLECPGIIEQVGNNVSRWKIGDQATEKPYLQRRRRREYTCGEDEARTAEERGEEKGWRCYARLKVEHWIENGWRSNMMRNIEQDEEKK